MYFRPVLVLILVLYVFLSDSDHHFIAFVNGGNAPSTQYYSMGDAAINCGSVGNSTALDGREWIGDASSKFLSGKSRTSAAAEKSFSIDPVPYKTSRISSTEFSYAFEVNPGQKFIRLHFYPASYCGFENSIDFFAVKAGPFTLLKDFSATLTAENTGLKYLVKEFCLNVEENRRLSITFLPSPITKSKLNIHAFVNGIEIISMPSGLYYTHDGDLGARVVGQKDGFYNIDNSTALEVTHRLNVGGSTISSVEDFGMFRRWSEDTNYLLQSGVDRVNHQALRIKYARMPEFIAPPKLYQMSWKAGGNVRVNRMYNITWKIPLELSFEYLVRLHFCQLDDGMAESKKREFSVLINNHIVETQADVIRWSGGDGIPVYRDYMVKMKGDKEGSKCHLLIALQSADKLVFGLLNGLEIFKLSNLGNSLATPNPTFPKRVSASWNWTFQKLFLAFGQSNVIVTGMTIFIVLVNAAVYSLRQIWEDKFNLETDKQTSRTERSYHRFTLVEIKSATQNFSDAFVIGRGGFGKVYKGYIPSISEIVAIKRLNFYSKQGPHEFWTEIDTLSKLRHVHLVSLLGYCNEGQEMILVYEYMPCGTLADNLYKLSRKGKDIDPLSWEQRLRICIGAARGLEYLHTGTECTVIHRDVKDSNILLDENFVAKISDFGLSKLEKKTQSKSYVSTKVRGTYGYLDPEYVMTQRLTRKTDVYAFGVVLLVVLSGRPAIDTKSQEHQSLLSCFRECITEGDFDRIVDPYLQGKILSKSLTEFLKSVENCLHHLPKKRPTMARVVASLEQALEQQESPVVSSSTNSAVNDREEIPILGENVVPSPEEGITSNPTQNPSSPTRGNDLPVIEENVIPSPEEGNTSSLTQNPYSLTRGNDLQPRRKDYARVPKPSRNWPWKAIWNKVFPTTVTAREAAAGAVGGAAGAGASSSKVEVTGASTREERNKLVFFDSGGYSFDLEDLLRASAEVLGKGSVGTSYRAVMEAGTTVVVKRLKDVVVSKKEFEQQMEVLGKIKHENVMRLRAYYYSKEEKLLFSDCLPAGGLSTLLHGSRGYNRTPLYWDTRKRIALAAARGLAHLHVAGKVVHGNIKSSNILLKQDHQDACVSDYGLNPLFTNLSPSNHRVAGYRAPEVLETRKVTFKSDVYSFGVLLLELLTGKAPNQASLVEEGIDLPRWIQSVVREEWTAEVIDLELLRYHHVEEEMVQLLQIGMSCVAVPDQRPAMQEVVRMIEDINRGETDDGLRQSSDDPSKGSDGHTPPQESRSFSRGVIP